MLRAARSATTDTSIARYHARRDFTRTAEPSQADPAPRDGDPIFVVQKHDATRLHYDFRLEHDGVLWSWAVPKGPSLDPHDKRLAVHVEDHPRNYAQFAGTIPEGQYGAGTVEIWDRGHWAPLSDDPARDLASGEMKFALSGSRLKGKFVLIRLKPRPKEKAETWLLVKEHDAFEQPGADVAALEAIPLARPRTRTAPRKPAVRPKPAGCPEDPAPAPGAERGEMPARQAPQLARLVEAPPEGHDWVSEIKFDGYRILIFKQGDAVRLLTRNGLDWTRRVPSVAKAVQGAPGDLLLDCELVALRPDGLSHFGDLQAALARGRDKSLVLYAFDLLHLNGWDLRPCRLADRRAVLAALPVWTTTLRFSEHVAGDAGPVRRQACQMGLEGIIAKRASAPYRSGRNGDWVKLKCQGREEFVVVGWTPPARSREGLGSLQLGFYDAEGALHYVGGVGTGFDGRELRALRKRLEPLAAPAPAALLWAGERPDRKIAWVRPDLVVEIQFVGWSGAGRIRHAVYLGLREDKSAADVVRDIPDREATRQTFRPPRSVIVKARPHEKASPPSRSQPARMAAPAITGDAVKLTHPDRALWPGITKQDLADYWRKVAPMALPGLAGRPLALVRCPEGVDGQHFFQKHAMKGMARQFREGTCDGAPYLVFEDADGLIAAAQMAAIELHSWGSDASDPAHADRLVFDLDPGPGLPWATVAKAAHEVRARLEKLGLAAFCRTSGGKGLHVVAPLIPAADWDTIRTWCRRFAETMAEEAPDRFVAAVPKAKRTGRILIDWLRNGLGATAVGSFSPRARPGAPVALPVAWRDVTAKLDPAGFTIATVPGRLGRLRSDPWAGFDAAARPLPSAGPSRVG